MAIPSDYFYRQGYYWKVDGTGPYQWNGTAMVLVDYGMPADPAATGQSDGFINRDASGPAVRR